MSKATNSELKFSIQSLITTTASKNSRQCIPSDSHHSQTSLPWKRATVEPSRPLARRPIPVLNPRMPHPYWPFHANISSKSASGTLPLHSPLVLLSKINQVWEQLRRGHVSATATTSTAPDADASSDEETDMETSSTHHEIDVDDEEINEEGECSSSGGGEQLKSFSNSDESDKLKTYPCTECGKVNYSSSILSDLKRATFFDNRSSLLSTI
jgi:hypothetical protein